MTIEEAKTHLKEWAGLEFDPKVVKAFLSSEDVKTLEFVAPERTITPVALPKTEHVDQQPRVSVTSEQT